MAHALYGKEESMSGDELSLGGLEGFEVWDRTVQAPVHQEVKTAYVSVRINGTIAVNKACYAMWGEPEAAQVMFDPDRCRIALKPVSRDEENCYPLEWSDRQMPAGKMFDFYGVVITHTRRYYDPKIIDGVLVVDL